MKKAYIVKCYGDAGTRVHAIVQGSNAFVRTIMDGLRRDNMDDSTCPYTEEEYMERYTWSAKELPLYSEEEDDSAKLKEIWLNNVKSMIGKMTSSEFEAFIAKNSRT